MFNLSYIKSQKKRYHIHPQKNVIMGKATQKQGVISDWKLAPSIHYCPFQGGGSDVVSVSCFDVKDSVMFHFMFVHYTFSSVWVT